MSVLTSRLRWALLAFAVLRVGTALAADPAQIRVGVRSGPGQQIVAAAAQLAAKSGLKVMPVVIDGLVNPNDALAGGDIEADLFQHVPYLMAEIHNKGYKLSPTSYIVDVSPMAVYSVRHHTLAELPQGGKIALPADNANLSRALLTLQYLGLLKLKPTVDIAKAPISLLDITDNPKKFQFTQLDVTMMPRIFPDVDAGVVSAAHALRIAKIPLSQAIGVEDPQRTRIYSDVLVVRTADTDKPWVKTLGESLQSPEVKALIVKEFGTSIVPAF